VVTGPVSWLSEHADVLVLVHDPRPGATGRLADLADRLARWYAPVLGPRTTARFRRWPDDAAGLVAVSRSPAAAELTDLVVWGLPVGPDGPCADPALARLLVDPAGPRTALGRFVAVGRRADRLVAVTSADLAHTLKRVAGDGVTAWATQSVAALLAADRPVRIDPGRVAEYLLFDYVLASAELLAEVVVLPEASRLLLGPGGWSEKSYWPVADRFAPGAPTSADRLRVVLGAELARLARVDRTELALTGGRDSTLLAAVAAAAGLRLDAFTIGYPDAPDVLAAAAVAGRLGWSHRLLPPGRGNSADWSTMLAGTRWTEGLDTAANLAGPDLVWDGPDEVSRVFGSGGETGRSFYHPGSPPPADPVRALTDWAEPFFRSAALAGVRDRLASELEAFRALRPADQQLDLLYARGRMRKWLARTRPRPEAVHAYSAYTSPAVTALLLDIPAPDRHSGGLFDRAVAAGPAGDLLAVARAAAPPRPRWRPMQRRRRDPLLGRVFDRMPAPRVVGDVLSPEWWARRRSVHEPRLTHLLWNAVAVELLAELTEQL
jgi:hypothetical protein